MIIEDRLRSALHERAEAIGGDERQAWARLQDSLQSGRRRSRRVVALVAAALLGVSIVASIAVLTDGSGDQVSTRRIAMPPSGIPPTWVQITDAENDLSVWAPPGWQRLEPATSMGGVERLVVGDAPRPAEIIRACADPSTTTPSSYVSIWEYPDGAALGFPGGDGVLTAASFQDRSTYAPTLADAGVIGECNSDGTVSFDVATAENRFSMVSFSDKGRRFYARVVVIGNADGERFAEAAQVLQSLEVEPLTTATTLPPPPPPVPPTLTDGEVRARLLEVQLFDAGDCRGFDNEPASCADEHVVEYFATYRFPAADMHTLAGGCVLLFAEYSGSTQAARPDLNITTQFAIDDGQSDVRQATCVISPTPPDAGLVGSERRASP